MALERFIGRYRVERPLGEGGMGTVYLAHDERIDRFVAIKLMRSDSEESLRRFKIEAKAAGRLKHPNIVTIYDFDIFDGNPCLIMEYVEGETIARLIARNEPLSIARKLELIEHVCRALAFAHRAGIVHRDIKPHNLMIERDGTVKVLDFGIARTTAAGAGTTGKIVGTVAYMSPEQALGRPVDLRSDIWAIGLVLYEFVTGRVAFAGDSDYSVLDRIVRGEPEPFKHQDHDVVAQLEPILTKALAKDPADRYQNAEVMARDLSETRRKLANLTETPTIVIRRPAVRPPIAPDPPEVKVTPAPQPPVVEARPPRSAPPPEVPPQRTAPAEAPPRSAPAPEVPRRAAASTVNPSQRSMVWAGVFVTAAAALAVGLWNVWPQPAVSITPAEPAPARAVEPAPNPTPPLTAQAPPVTPAPEPSANAAAPDVKKVAPPEARKAAAPDTTGASADRPVDPPPPPRPSVDYSARVAAARDAFESGDYAAALQRYEAVLRDDPGNADATRGVQTVRAAQAAERKLFGPSGVRINIDAVLTHARSRFEEGDYDGAISAYEEVLKADSRNARALSGLAEARKAKAAEDAILKRPAKKPGV